MEGTRGRKKQQGRSSWVSGLPHALTGGAAGGYRSQKGEERGGTCQEETRGRLVWITLGNTAVYRSWRR